MMKIKIVAPGKIREKWLEQGISEYVKRCSTSCKIEIIEVAVSPDSIPVDKGIYEEGQRILSHIKPSDKVWAIDLHGKLLTSEEFSSHMISDIEAGGSSLTIVIGGSNGIASEVTTRANRRICFGNMTMTHTLTRLVLMEQIYRGFKIYEGSSYHK